MKNGSLYVTNAAVLCIRLCTAFAIDVSEFLARRNFSNTRRINDGMDFENVRFFLFAFNNDARRQTISFADACRASEIYLSNAIGLVPSVVVLYTTCFVLFLNPKV